MTAIDAGWPLTASDDRRSRQGEETFLCRHGNHRRHFAAGVRFSPDGDDGVDCDARSVTSSASSAANTRVDKAPARSVGQAWKRQWPCGCKHRQRSANYLDAGVCSLLR